MKVGLIGIGGMGFVHFNCYKKMADMEICVADVRVDMAKEKIKDDTINVYSSLEELLANENVDFIDVCTPSYLHAEQTITALNAGKHVLCEKPMSTNSADAAKMIEAADRNGKLLMIAHVVRFMAPYVYLKSVIDSGELGKPVHFIMNRLSGVPLWSWENWLLDEKRSGGVPMDLSIHDIDFAQYALGAPKSVSAVWKQMADNNEYISSELVYDGFSAQITGSWYKADNFPFSANYIAVFENGYIKCDGDIIKNGERVSLDMGDTSEDTGINLSGADGYADEIAYFVDCIKTGRKPQKVTPESSKYSVELVEKLKAGATIV